ncbi:MAG: aspartate aminotransferase family protein [Hydrotalea sp.]|nr:aspartate aminotransferase family protein [Hydrotalea sp.]
MTNILHNVDDATLKKYDIAHHIHPFTDHKALADAGGPRIITSASGCYLTDKLGNKILDGMAGLWCATIGYGNTDMAKAVSDQVKELSYYNTFFKTSHPPVIALSKKLAELHNKPRDKQLNYFFFGSSGSESNDTVLRLVRRYWQLKGKPEKMHVISRKNAYHGSTIAGLSLGGMGYMHDQTPGMIPGIHHVRQPYWYGEGGEMSEDEFGLLCAKAVEDKINELGVDKVAAFIGEPVQGAGGVIIPPKTYWPAVAEICKKHGILLVMDEVICGFGRLGTWFGHQHYDLDPDLVTMAKGLSSGYVPMSGVAVKKHVLDTLDTANDDFAHGYTYSGHPVGAAAALKNLEIIEDQKLIEKVKNETGPYLAKKLAEISDMPIVGQVRSLGLIGAIELVKDKKTRARFPNEGSTGTVCRDHFFAHNVILRATRDTMLISPPLIIDKNQIDDMFAVIKTCLDLTWKDVNK